MRTDRRYAFLFSDSVAIRDVLSRIVGRLMIPVNGKPLTIIDLSGVPTEITDVVVSLVCRLTQNRSAQTRERSGAPPRTRGGRGGSRARSDHSAKLKGATSRAITRIAREGRKYGVSLALISQTPSELSAEVLSQRGTVFAMRLGHYLDQTSTGTTWADAARGMLGALPTMRTQEAIAFGEGVPLPMSIGTQKGPRIGMQKGPLCGVGSGLSR